MLTRTDIEKYFIAEKQAALFFLIFGVVVIVVVLALFFLVKSPLAKGASFTLLFFALIQVLVGFTIYTRSDKDRVNIVYALDMNPQVLKDKELPRIVKVNKQFTIYKTVAVVFIVAALLLILFFNNKNLLIVGMGIGLLVQSLAIFMADYFAHKRAIHYQQLLEKTVNKQL